MNFSEFVIEKNLEASTRRWFALHCLVKTWHAGCSEIRITEGPVRGAAWTDKRPYDKRVMKKACEDNPDPQFFGTFR